MAVIPLANLGTYGIVTDVPAYSLPSGAWSGGQNVRFLDNRVHKFLGKVAVFGIPSIVPYWLLPVAKTIEYFWIYAGLTKVYCTDMTSHFNLTRQTASVDVDYTTTATEKWTGGVLGGIPILNNFSDEPQMWNPVQTSQRLQLLSNWGTWPGGVSTRARCMRPFDVFLLALDVTESGTRDPHLLVWSHPAAPGAVPSSWNYTDATKKAGRKVFGDSNGFLLDSLPLGRTNVLYKEDAAHAMQFIGGTNVFRFERLPIEIGLMARHCAVLFKDRHYVVTGDDIVVHNLGGKESIIDGRRRKQLFGDGSIIDTTNKNRSYVVPNYKKNEIWFCFPEVNSAQPNRALVWNYKENTLSDRFLYTDASSTRNSAFAAIGLVNPSDAGDTWDAAVGSWDSDPDIWDKRAYDPNFQSVLVARTDTAAFHLMDSTNQEAGSNFTAFVERTGMAFTGVDRQGRPVADHDSIKLVNRVVPHLKASGPVNFYVGSQNTPEGAITWSGPFIFDPAVDREFYPDVTGLYYGIKVESTTNISWELDKMEINVEIVGGY